jgi:hypothetical protein
MIKEKQVPPVCKCGIDMVSSELMMTPDFERPVFHSEIEFIVSWDCVFGKCDSVPKEVQIRRSG